MVKAKQASIAISGLRVRTTILSDGERCPILRDGTGLPLFDPTVWSATKYRQASAGTMEQALRGAMFIHLFCWRHGIDLTQRINDGAFFDLGELDALIADAFKPLESLRDRAVSPSHAAPKAPRERRVNHYLVSIKRKLPRATKVRVLNPITVVIRIYYGTEYMRWLGARQKSRLISNARGVDDTFLRAHNTDWPLSKQSNTSENEHQLLLKTTARA